MDSFCKRLGRTKGAYSRIENGQKGISFKFIKELISEFNINPNYIYLGHEPMFLTDEVLEIQQLKSKLNTLQKENEDLKGLLTEKEDLLKARQEIIEKLRGQLGDDIAKK